jgi:hypothetical protein
VATAPLATARGPQQQRHRVEHHRVESAGHQWRPLPRPGLPAAPRGVRLAPPSVAVTVATSPMRQRRSSQRRADSVACTRAGNGDDAESVCRRRVSPQLALVPTRMMLPSPESECGFAARPDKPLPGGELRSRACAATMMAGRKAPPFGGHDGSWSRFDQNGPRTRIRI